jgi:protoporphyrinogen oxidase
MTGRFNAGEDPHIAIVGAGPTGLGAAYRLSELGYTNFVVYEKEAYAGGLAASFLDEEGFVWDIGGHIHFSHYDYFDDLMDCLLPNEWISHKRESWIWTHGAFVPYPFQSNIHRLPHDVMRECLRGLIRARCDSRVNSPSNYEEWILHTFGEGIAKHFMLPYSLKVWAYEPRELGYGWVGDRVAQIDLERIIFNVIDGVDDVNWGPNATFRFPRQGGTGEIWRRLASRLDGGVIRYNMEVQVVDTVCKILHFENGSTSAYDLLISTLPIDVLVRKGHLSQLTPIAARLKHSATHVVGIALTGAPPASVGTKGWMYFPDVTMPFYRVTVFSKLSPNNVPDMNRFWSLLVEVSESPYKSVDGASLIDRVIGGLTAAKLISSPADITRVWQFRSEYGYPTPALDRDEVLAQLHPVLEGLGIFSRGRFGAWMYEVSNQDHSVMQGVELVDRLLLGSEERTIVVPSTVNSNRRNEYVNGLTKRSPRVTL